MNAFKIFAVIAVPVVLFLHSFFTQEVENKAVTENPQVLSKMVEIPDYVYTVEFQLAAQKKFIETYDQDITQDLLSQPLRWLGNCYENNLTGECGSFAGTNIKCGDKVRWGGKVYCLDW